MGKIFKLLEEHSTKLVQGLVGIVILLACGIVYLLSNQNNVQETKEDDFFTELNSNSSQDDFDVLIETEEDGMISEKDTLQNNENIFVDVKGAVQSPGVYEMESGTRVIDCIEKAGGLVPEAEQKLINLAQRLEDQMVIYIPVVGEELVDIHTTTINPIGTETLPNDTSKINLNQATKEELKQLNGIGDVKADNIISYRETNGQFQNIEEIKNVSGIGAATFDKIQEEITVNP